MANLLIKEGMLTDPDTLKALYAAFPEAVESESKWPDHKVFKVTSQGVPQGDDQWITANFVLTLNGAVKIDTWNQIHL